MNKTVTLAILLSFSIFLHECYSTMMYSFQVVGRKHNEMIIPTSTTSVITNTPTILPKNVSIIKSVKVLPKVVEERKVNVTLTNITTALVPKQVNTSKPKVKMNSYERMLLEKKALRDNFAKKFAKQQNEEILPSNDTTKYVVFKPGQAGFGNSMAVLAEALLFAYFSKRHFYSRYFLPFPNI